MHSDNPLRRNARLAPIATAALTVIGALIIMTIAPRAEAAACGALNQKPCPVWKRIPSCDKGLVEDFAKGRCVRPKPIILPRPKNCGGEGKKPCPLPHVPSCNGRLVEDFTKNICRRSDADIINMAKDTISQSGRLIEETALALKDCATARTVLERGGSRLTQVNALQSSECVLRMIEGARRAGYKSFSLGLGTGLSFGLGADAEAGFVFDTAHINPPAFYTAHGVSAGFQAGGGVSFVAGYGNSPNRPGKSQGHGASIGFAAVGGTGASSWYGYDGAPDGISVVVTAGGEFSAAYGRNETNIFAIPGAKPAPVSGPKPVPAPGPIAKAEISGEYFFGSDKSSVNIFRMATPDMLQAANLINGKPNRWHNYARISDRKFRAVGSTPTYELQPDGSLVWLSNRPDRKRIVLMPR